MSLSKRATTLLAMAMVADGMAFATNPEEQIRLWSSARAPRWYRQVMDYFGAHTRLCRMLAGAELAAGAAILAGSRD